ncbi:hypothetical protein D3C73_1607540 [compost metagenome]
MLDLADLAVTLIAADNLLEHRPKLAALPRVETTLQLGLPDRGRVLAVKLPQYVGEQQAFA